MLDVVLLSVLDVELLVEVRVLVLDRVVVEDRVVVVDRVEEVVEAVVLTVDEEVDEA